MWVINNEKERVKTYLQSDIESNRTNITDASNHVYRTISAINYVMDGSVIGAGRKVTDDCQQAMQKLQEALNMLAVCRNCVDQLDTGEWVDDDQY